MATIVPIQLRGDTAANWTANNTVLRAREMAVETDTGKFKVGNGTTAWNSLAYGGLTATNPTFSGTVTATTFSGDLTGTAASATTASKMNVGSSFPSSPGAGQFFFRTDQKIAYIYNGTGWDELSRPNAIEPFLLIGI